MTLRLEITIPPQIALDLDPRKVRAVLRSAGSEIGAMIGRMARAARSRNTLPPEPSESQWERVERARLLRASVLDPAGYVRMLKQRLWDGF